MTIAAPRPSAVVVKTPGAARRIAIELFDSKPSEFVTTNSLVPTGTLGGNTAITSFGDT